MFSYFIIFITSFLLTVPVQCKDTLMPLDKMPTPVEPSMNHDDFSLFPVEEPIPDFPEPVDAMETDLSILIAHYSELAAVYNAWCKAHMQKAHTVSRLLHPVKNHLPASSLRQGL